MPPAITTEGAFADRGPFYCQFLFRRNQCLPKRRNGDLIHRMLCFDGFRERIFREVSRCIDCFGTFLRHLCRRVVAFGSSVPSLAKSGVVKNYGHLGKVDVGR